MPFFRSLSLDLLATMEELYRRADRYSMLEDNGSDTNCHDYKQADGEEAV